MTPTEHTSAPKVAVTIRPIPSDRLPLHPRAAPRKALEEVGVVRPDDHLLAPIVLADQEKQVLGIRALAQVVRRGVKGGRADHRHHLLILGRRREGLNAKATLGTPLGVEVPSPLLILVQQDARNLEGFAVRTGKRLLVCRTDVSDPPLNVGFRLPRKRVAEPFDHLDEHAIASRARRLDVEPCHSKGPTRRVGLPRILEDRE